jgi:sigma-54 specific flagellar transcriptional regulator A
MNCLMRCRWPGNVRELGNLLERLGILYPDQTVTAADLPERYRVVDSSDWFGSGVRIEPADVPAMKAEPPAAEGLPIPAAISTAPDDVEVVPLPVLPPRTAPGSPEASLPSGGIDLKDHLSAIELGLIRKALREADGTVAEAARLLKMRRTTLVEKLRTYRLHA